MGKDRGHRHSERERMKWNFNGYMPIQSTVNPEPPNPPTSGSNAQKDTETHAYRTCRDCFARIVGFYNGTGEWKYCPYCGAKLQKEKTENV